MKNHDGTRGAPARSNSSGAPVAEPTRKVDLRNLDLEGLEALVASRGWARYRAVQLMQWLYQKDVAEFGEMTNISKAIRKELEQIAVLTRLEPVRIVDSEDGSRKFVFALADGSHVESVLIPEPGRVTVCVSSQVGCPLACSFCVTGQGGFVRNLSVSEMVGQVQAVTRHLEGGQGVTNIVVMGMGEPLLNMDNLVPALKIFLSEYGFNLSHRRITVSTAGIVPGMEQLGKAVPVNLAVSINATTEEVRRQLMPVSRKYPLTEVLDACRRYPRTRRKKITFEYVLIAGVNDSTADAARLLGLVHGIPAKVNVIPYNETPRTGYRAPTFEAVKAFQHYLVTRGVHAAVRWSRGRDIGAACGQLGNEEAARKRIEGG